MEEISKPTDFKRKFPKVLFPIIIIVGLVAASFVLIPYLNSLNASKELKGFTINGFTADTTSSTNNSLILRLNLTYYNEYTSAFTLENQSLTLWMQNTSQSPWQEVGSLYNNRSFSVPNKGSCSLTTCLSVSNSVSDSMKRIFLGTIVMHGNFTVKITGEIKIGNKTETNVPDILQVETSAEAKTVFQYEVPDASPSLFVINDLHTPGVDSANPTKFLMGITARYANPLPLPVDFVSLTAKVLNRTLDGIMGDFNVNSSNLGSVPAFTTKNFSASFLLYPPQIGWIVSDLISAINDVIKLQNIAGLVKIGNVSIMFHRAAETEKTSFSFKLSIIGYAVEGSDLYLDVEFVNPCDLIFNLTYLDLKMYLANTFQKLVWIDEAMNYSIAQYSTTRVTHLKVNANVASFLQHVNDKYDLAGTLTVNCYNYNGDIPFNTYDVVLIS